LVSKIVVTFGCQLLPKHFKIFIFSSSLSKYLPTPIKWLTILVNRSCISTTIYPCCIQNNSYSWIKACFLALLTSLVPSWVTSSISHISFSEEHCDTLKNSSRFKTYVIICLAMHSYWTFFFSISISSSKDFWIVTPFTTITRTNGLLTIAFQIPWSIDSIKIFLLTFQN